jgi:GH15 family glucan-1,4-alpha-glucosidase
MFTQTLDGDEPDASCLLLPVIGMLDAHDPRFHSTVDEYGKRLMDRGLMRRYRNADDLGTSASTFTICTFWYVQALALMDRLDEAIELFHHVCSFANPLGLFSEDVDPETGALLGNFPQAYAHVGLINAAMRIGQRLEAASGHTVIGG